MEMKLSFNFNSAVHIIPYTGADAGILKRGWGGGGGGAEDL